ncbi:MAG: NERD domain-containing protein [Actinomycetota bacterium]|nr:NERD domain-containing protein [Actinomycetota bacterium]
MARIVALLVLFAAAAFVVVDWLFGQRPAVAVVASLLALLILIRGLAWRAAPERPTVDLDREVAAELERLVPDGFAVLHGLRFNDHVLEHVVIGPPGVYVVASAAGGLRPAQPGYPDGGILTRRAEEAQLMAERLGRRIGSRVNAVVAVTQPDLPRVLDGAALVPMDHMTEWFRGQQAGWSLVRVQTVQSTVLEVFRAVRDSSDSEDQTEGRSTA